MNASASCAELPRAAGRALAGALTALPAPLLAAEGGAGTGEMLRVVLGLALVLGLIVALAWGLRRLGGPGAGAGGRLRVLAGVAVGNRERVVLLQAGETQLLLGVAPGRVQTLHVLERPLEAVEAAAAGEGGSFAERLRQAMGGRRP